MGFQSVILQVFCNLGCNLWMRRVEVLVCLNLKFQGILRSIAGIGCTRGNPSESRRDEKVDPGVVFSHFEVRAWLDSEGRLLELWMR